MQRIHQSSASHKGAFTQVEAVKIFLGVLFYFAVSQISIPLQPVPMTFQTFGMLMVGLTYSRREAFYTTGSWFLGGLFGLPIFAGYEAGPAVLFGPKGGFLVALVLVPVIMAWAREVFKMRHFVSLMVLAASGTVLLFTSGLVWLSHLIGWEKAAVHGLFPFLLWDTLKTVSAAVAAYTLTRKRL